MVRKKLGQKEALSARKEILGEEMKGYWKDKPELKENTPVNLLLDQLEKKHSSELPEETKTAIQEILAIHNRNQKHVEEIETRLKKI